MKTGIYGCSLFGYDAFTDFCRNSQAQPIAAILYFVSFIVLGTMIILNLLIGVVVNGMAESHKEIEGPSPDAVLDNNAILNELRILRAEMQSLAEKTCGKDSSSPVGSFKPPHKG